MSDTTKWRVGEFKSSSNPRNTVLMLAVGSDIEAHEKHHSFIRWVDATPKLAVWYGSMPESNGKTNWTAILHKGDIAHGMTIDRSEYPDRVRYEADRVRWLIGELAEDPFILDYDADKHSGYVTPPPAKLSTETVDKPVHKLTMLDPRVKEVFEAFMIAYRCKGWEGDWAYLRAEMLLRESDSATASDKEPT